MAVKVLSVLGYYDGPLSGALEWEGRRCYYLWLNGKSLRVYGVWFLSDAEWAAVERDQEENTDESASALGALHDELMSRPPVKTIGAGDVSWPSYPTE